MDRPTCRPQGAGLVVAVTGSRNLRDQTRVIAALERVPPTPWGIRVLVHGGQRGADAIAAYWGARLGFVVYGIKADWTRFGKAAGPIRNRRIIVEWAPDLVLAFPLPESVGTYDMVKQAEQRGIKVEIWNG